MSGFAAAKAWPRIRARTTSATRPGLSSIIDCVVNVTPKLEGTPKSSGSSIVKATPLLVRVLGLVGLVHRQGVDAQI